jgi:hypothetical protein
MAMILNPLVQWMNQKLNSTNIMTTAEEIRLEEQTGRKYTFGWVPRDITIEQLGVQDAIQFQGLVAEVPEPIRKAMTELIRGNLLSDNPTPMIFQLDQGAAHRILVDSGQDSVSPTVPAIVITMVCRT